ncbi:MAG: hypothetical protein RLZZ303_1188 [Candidatus Hydrogenedentota bacterium]
MDVSPIVYAIPVFFLLITFELVVSLLLKKRVYRVSDTVNDLSMGIIDQVGGAFITAIMFTGYMIIWTNFRFFEMSVPEDTPYSFLGAPWWAWVVCFIAKDFAYYWAHRMSHEMNVGWASHIAHHQSEEYNLSVALRQGVFQGFFFNIFYFPLALMGFPPAVYGLCSITNTLYQFWIHTRIVPKLGPIEWIMNTPSHHRVHHGRDVKYIDRNHAGVFIIWDRMFGTFQEEEEEPHYGLVSPLRSWNPLWGQVHYFVRLVKTAIAAPRPLDKLKVWFMAPSWQPEGLPSGPSSQELWARGELQRYETRTPLPLKVYVLLHFIPLNILVTGWLKALENHASLKQLFTNPAANLPLFQQSAITAVLIIGTLFTIGGTLECRRWVPYVETLRVLAMGGLLHFMGPGYFGWPELDGAWFTIANAVLFGLSLAMLALRRSDFTGPIITMPATEGPMWGSPEPQVAADTARA